MKVNFDHFITGVATVGLAISCIALAARNAPDNSPKQTQVNTDKQVCTETKENTGGKGPDGPNTKVTKTECHDADSGPQEAPTPKKIAPKSNK